MTSGPMPSAGMEAMRYSRMVASPTSRCRPRLGGTAHGVRLQPHVVARPVRPSTGRDAIEFICRRKFSGPACHGIFGHLGST